MEYQVEINGVSYDEDDLFSVEIHRSLFSTLSVGNTCAAELTITFAPKGTIPRMASIKVFGRKAAEDPWGSFGVFFTDVRKNNGGLMEITAYDAMLKAEQVFLAEGDTGEWPRTQTAVVAEICTRMGVELDSRTVLGSYPVEYPNDFTMREILGYIAAAQGGNWIVTGAGKLLLIPLFGSMPSETSYLVTEDGDAIVMGDVRLVV